MTSLKYLGISDDGILTEKETVIPKVSGGSYTLRRKSIASGTIRIPTHSLWATAINSFSCPIPEGDDESDFLLLNLGKIGTGNPVSGTESDGTTPPQGDFYLVDRKALLALDEADYGETVTASNRIVIYETRNNRNLFLGWITDPDDSDQKLLTVSYSVSEVFFDLELSRIVVERDTSSVSGSVIANSEFRLRRKVIGQGNVNVTVNQTWPLAENIPRLEIPEGPDAPDFLILEIGKATATSSLKGQDFWIDRKKLLTRQEAGYNIASSAATRLFFNAAVNISDDMYAGWVTDPNDSSKKLFLLTSSRSSADFLEMRLSYPVVDNTTAIVTENELNTQDINIKRKLITSGNINVTTANDWPSAANMPKIVIPEGDDAPEMLLLAVGRPTTTHYEHGGIYWIDISIILSKTESSYSGDRSTSNAYLIPDSTDSGTDDIYLGWITDPDNASQKLLLITTSSAAEDLYNFKVWIPVIPQTVVRESSAVQQQQSVTSLGSRTLSAILWRRSALLPAPPPTDWWSEGTGIVSDTRDWYHTRAAALAADPASSDPVWFALDRVSVSPDGSTRIYNGWDVLAEFGVEYSADGLSWHPGPQLPGDKWFGFLTPSGERRVLEVAVPDDFSWVRLLRQNAYQRSSAHASAPFEGTVNLDLYRSLRFTWQSFGGFTSGEPDRLGARMTALLGKPHDGWKTSAGDNDDDDGATHSWWFDEIAGAAVVLQGEQSRSDLTLPPARVRNGSPSLPSAALAGKLKLIRAPGITDPAMVSSLRNYGFVPGSSWRRFWLQVDGRVV